MPRLKPIPNLSTVPAETYYQTLDPRQISNIYFPKGDSYAAGSYQKIPYNLKYWLWFEQTHNNKRFDSDYFPPPDDSRLRRDYLPEARNLIHLPAFRVKADMLDKIHTHNSAFANLLEEDPGYYTLLVHPSILDGAQGQARIKLLFKLGCTVSERIFYFLPAASPRTGLTWELGKETLAFFTKMSIQPEVDDQYGQKQKTDLSPEGKIAVAKTHTLLVSSSTIKDNFFHDELSIEFKPGYARYATSSYNVMFRKIPQELMYGNEIYIPFFSLASTPSADIKPLFIFLLEQSGQSLVDFIDQYFYQAVMDFLIDNTRSQMFAEHLHGQNLLIKLALSPLGEYKHLTGLLASVKYRDITDMKIGVDMESRILKSMREQEQQPASSFTPGAYLYLATINFIRCSIVPILFALKDWQAAGWLPQSMEINHTKLIMPLFVRITDYLLSMMRHQDQNIANDAYTTMYEFAHLVCTEQRMIKGTLREREWLNILADDFFKLFHQYKGQFDVAEIRLKRLQEHLRLFTEDLTQRYNAIDRMREEQSRTSDSDCQQAAVKFPIISSGLPLGDVVSATPWRTVAQPVSLPQVTTTRRCLN